MSQKSVVKLRVHRRAALWRCSELRCPEGFWWLAGCSYCRLFVRVQTQAGLCYSSLAPADQESYIRGFSVDSEKNQHSESVKKLETPSDQVKQHKAKQANAVQSISQPKTLSLTVAVLRWDLTFDFTVCLRSYHYNELL